jgi:hypothetical protein
MEASLSTLIADGYMSPAMWRRCRVAYGEEAPAPAAHEVVVFARFFERGLDFPVSDFLRGILYTYGLRIHHLNPNTIFHLSIFATFCVAWLGINPNLDLLRYYFRAFAVPGDSPLGALVSASAPAIGRSGLLPSP